MEWHGTVDVVVKSGGIGPVTSHSLGRRATCQSALTAYESVHLATFTVRAVAAQALGLVNLLTFRHASGTIGQAFTAGRYINVSAHDFLISGFPTQPVIFILGHNHARAD